MPGIVAVILGFVASGYLVFQGFYNREVAVSVRRVSIPAVTALASIQQERRLSVAYLGQPTKGVQELLVQRQQTDTGLAAMRTAANSALANAPASILTRWKALTDYLDRLAGVRSTIDARTVDAQRAYSFYNDLLDAATNLFDTQARVVPDVTATQGGIAATEVFRASDLMSRAGSVINSAFSSRALNDDSYLEFVYLVGAYRDSMDNVAPHLRLDVRQRYEALTTSGSWKELVAAENAIIAGGAWRKGVPRSLRIDQGRWDLLTSGVSDGLIKLTIAQADEVSARALDTGNNQLLFALIGSLLALSLAIGAILWAVRQSGVLVDQALSVRLARLGEDASAMVDEQLPAVMDRLRRQQQVDLAVALPTQDYGSDEIGQVAEVINRSLRAAAGAAVDEARTRAASVAMLMGIARRPQRPVQRGLKIVEDLETRIGDENLLANVFDLNHQLTQTRRFLENLVILAGGQIGRRFQKPVSLRRVLLAAFAETRHYQRVQLRGAPDVALAGQAVAGTVHLLAELLDNALAFSSPETTVWVTCYQVKHGVAVEIEDAGVGMTPEALQHANDLLATAPTPDVTELKDGAQVGLHVVAALAKRDGIQVSLRRSAYGGLLAIVLVPDQIITAETTDLPAGGDEAATPPPARVVPAASADARRDRSPVAGVGVAVATIESVPGAGMRQPAQEQLPVAAAVGIPTQPGPPDAAWPTQAGPREAARPSLPQRKPQHHLAAELRDEGASGGSGGPAPARSPEEARERFSRYQRGRADGVAARSDETVAGVEQGGTP